MPTRSHVVVLVDAILELRRLHIKTSVRLAAIEAVMLEAIPESDQLRLHKRIDELEAHFHQTILERFEDLSPDVAAILDERKPDEMP